MYYLIQENTYKEKNFDNLIHNLERLGLEYEICLFRPFIHEVYFETTRKDVFCFGAYSMTETASKYGFEPGCMANENHDYMVYGQMYGDYMLNSDSIIMEIGDPIPEGEDWNLFFVRPTKDSKMFSGMVYDRETWNKYLEVIKANNAIDEMKGMSKIQIAQPKNIQQEIRCWVVGGKVVTISQYKIGSRVHYQNLDHDKEVWNFAQQMTDIFQPARAFVIDVCRTEDGMKIVEINCINSAGFYDMNTQKLLMALEDEFNPPIYPHPTMDGIYVRKGELVNGKRVGI